MGLFKRPKSSGRRVLPDDTAMHLESWGHNDFDSSREVSSSTVEFVSWLQTDVAVQARPDVAAHEIEQIAMSAGGWAIYGGWRMIHAFLPSQTESRACQSLLTERVKFLRSLELPDLKIHLSAVERTRYEELYPNELA